MTSYPNNQYAQISANQTSRHTYRTFYACSLRFYNQRCQYHMSHFANACKMQYPLNLVLESWEYLSFYWTFCIVILDYGLKLHKLSNHTLVMLQKWLEIHEIIVFTLCSIFCHICYGKISEKNVNTFIKVKLFVSKTSDSCFQGFDFFQMLLASHR